MRFCVQLANEKVLGFPPDLQALDPRGVLLALCRQRGRVGAAFRRLWRRPADPGARKNAVFAGENPHKNGIFPAWG